MNDPRNPLNRNIPTFQRPPSSQPMRHPTNSRLSRPNNNSSLPGNNLPSNNNPNRSRNFGNKSRLSQGSYFSDDSHQLAAIVSDGDIFPQDLLFLLSDEERNINAFKERIQKEKQRLDTDFKLFSKQVQHIIEDLKISLQAELDNVYRFFIEKYANLKTQVQDIRRIRKEIESQNYGQDFHTSYGPSKSNKELIKELERDAENYKLFRIQSYITQMQKKKLNPLLDISREIILLATSTSSFYSADHTLKQLTELKQSFSHFIKHMFSGISQYITNPKTIIDENMLADLEEMDPLPDQDLPPIPKTYPQPPPQRPVSPPYAHQPPPQSYPSYQQVPVVFQPNPPAYIQPNVSPYLQPTVSDFHRQMGPMVPAPTKPIRSCNISNSQQILAVDWAQNISVKPYSTISAEHSEIVLCAMMILGKYIVTGGKDSLLNVYSLSDGTKVSTLRGHEASICTLTLVNDPQQGLFLASGSDYGCSSIIIWNTQNWTIRHKIKSHLAAVTSILDLCDGQTLASGSYDKKINIYNYKKAETMYSLPGNKAPVTSMVLNSNKSRIVSSGLDNTLTVWYITRKKQSTNAPFFELAAQIKGTVESIALERVIQNNNMICSINSSLLRPDVVIAGTKDGKIKLWNIGTGDLEREYTANNNAILELVVIEREAKPNAPMILSCSSKDKALMLTRVDTGSSTFFEVASKLNVEFGCGIGPKIIFDQDRLTGSLRMGLVSQAPERKQVNVFQLNIS